MKIAESLLLLLCTAQCAQASLTTYRYIGNDFGNASIYYYDPATPPSPVPTRITATVTLAQAIPANSSVSFYGSDYSGLDLLGWSVSDGSRTVTGPDAGIISLYTDAHGAIDHWTVAVGTYAFHAGSYDFSINSWGPGTPCSDDYLPYYGAPVAGPGCPADFTYNVLFNGPDPSIPSAVVYGGSTSGPGVWTSTPEPGSTGMLLLGTALLLAMAAVRRRILAPKPNPAWGAGYAIRWLARRPAPRA